METYQLNTDGGARGNPGPAAIGGILKGHAGEVARFKEKIGNNTNNFAEYTALIKGLDLAIMHQVKKIKCVLDSELVIKQLNGQYKVKEESLKILYNQVKQLALKFDHIEFVHVKRADNKEADKLVNLALDS